jgi:putative nucleotidyltransferase with HDIG domain
MTVLPPRLLIVDDEAPVREFLADALTDVCAELRAVGDLKEALHALASASYDVVLADICMPGCSGMDLLHLAKQFRWDSAIILMTGHASLDLVASSVRLHAADFLVKPFSLADLLRSINGAYQRLLVRRELVKQQNQLCSGLRERTEQLELARQTVRETYRSALESMVATLEAREPETYAHSFRVRAYAMHLAELMNYPATQLPRLAYAGLLHDIGKIAVSDAVLLKPGKLTAEEFKALQVHPIAGERIIQRMGFLQEEAKLIRHHHEHWNGRGYPDGLRGNQIPFGARLFAVADTLDAMTSNRCYRAALTLTDARKEIAACAGAQFDPEVARAFATVAPETWLALREQADASAHAATIPEFNRDSLPDFSPELLELSPSTVGL